MPPVANPDLEEATTSSSSSSRSSMSKEKVKQFSWPEAVQLRLKELQESLEEEEITRKGYWKKMFLTVEKLLTKDQLKKVTGLQTDYKAGKVSDDTYFEQLKTLLVPLDQVVDEGVENESEAKLWDAEDTETAKETKDAPAASSFSSSSSSVSAGDLRPKRDRKQPSIQSMFSKANKRKSAAEISSKEKKLKEEGDSKPADEGKMKKTADPVSVRCKICRQFVDSPDLLR